MFDWLTRTFRKAHVPHHLQALTHTHNPPAPPLSPSTLNVYGQSPWVYLAVNRIAEAGALVPLHVYTLDGERLLEVTRHPLERLLDHPNPFTSRFELFEQTLGYLELTGNAYWLIVGDAHGRPAEIWSLRPDRVAIVPDAERYIKGYLYEVDGHTLPLDCAEVVHFKRWHPANDYYGLSALSSARLAVENDRAMSRWNRGAFGEEAAIPAGIVSIRDTVSDTDFDRIKREWLQQYGNGQRRTAFLRGSAVTWQGIGMNHHDLDFLQGRKAQRDEILNLFGVPVALISENATEANAKVAERLFIERTLYPKLVRIAQKITQEILPFYSGDSVAMFEDIRPTDAHARLQEIRTARGILTTDELRERYFHLPPQEARAVTLPPQEARAVTSPPQEARAVKSPPLQHGEGDLGGEVSPLQHGEGDLGGEVSPLQHGEGDLVGEVPGEVLEELAQWQRYALKRLGRRNPRPFTPRHTPPALAFELSARLLTAHTPSEIRAVFREVSPPAA